MKGIPVGIRDFRSIREQDLYLIDKSGLIDRILSRKLTGAFLFTRPPGFGKSVNLSMIDAYLNRDYSGNGWFDGLEISDLRPNDPEKNAYPVVTMDMKDLSSESFDDFVESYQAMMANLYERHVDSMEHLMESRRRRFQSIIDMSSGKAVLRDSLQDLLETLRDSSGKGVVLLIDDYDSVVNRAHGLKGVTVLYGVAFSSKTPVVASRTAVS